VALVPVFAVWGAPGGVLVASAAFGLVVPAAALLPRAPVPPRGSWPDPAVDDDDMRPPHAPERRAGLRLLGRSRLLWIFAAATASLVMVRYGLRYQQQLALEALPEVDLAAALARYAIAANAVGIVLSVFVVGRLLRGVGLGRASVAYVLLAGGAQIALLLTPGLGAALFARFVDGELKHVLKTPVSSLFYEAFPATERVGARAFVLGVVSPSTQVLAAAGLAALVGAPAWAALAAGIACALLLGSTLAQNRGYEASMRS
jgi:hypothetical protein